MPTFCPYPGLRAFLPSEREWYFGREAHIDAMLTRLESNRALAIVGSSGSGKSSLVFAGLIPALHEGLLAGSRGDADGAPAPWHIVNFNPGNDPLEELAVAILKAALIPDDPHLPGYVRASLLSGERGLIDALRAAGLLDTQGETLIYADQFEELFRFGEDSTRAAQENALRFARLFVATAEQQSVRLHVLLSMRSEFIGQCERFPGLPELVSGNQFLTPRLTRNQLEQSLRSPATAAGWTIAPDALTAILNDCGNSPDPLPLAQHVLRRMWMRAAQAQRTKLTFDDYTEMGGIRNSIAKHGDAILDTLPQPAGTEVARVLFMALCDQREEGPLVRRLSTHEEVEAIAGEDAKLVSDVIAAFAGDDPGFVRDAKGVLDVRHEAVLRQWPQISVWRAREAKSEAWLPWLRELSLAAQIHDRNPDDAQLWSGSDLRKARAWMATEKPTEGWALHHGLRNLAQSIAFLERSFAKVSREEEDAIEAENEAREQKERRQQNWLKAVGAIAAALLFLGIWVTTLWNTAVQNEDTARKASEALLTLIKANGEAAVGVVESVEAALRELEQQAAKLISAIEVADTKSPPEKPELEEFQRRATAAEGSVLALERFAQSIRQAAQTSKDPTLIELAATLEKQASASRDRQTSQQKSTAAAYATTTALMARVADAEYLLNGLIGWTSMDMATVKSRANDISGATAQVNAIDAITAAGLVLGFDGATTLQLSERIADIKATLRATYLVQNSEIMPGTIMSWMLAKASQTEFGSKINRVRFAPNSPSEWTLLAVACESSQVYFWRIGVAAIDVQFAIGVQTGTHANNDIDFSPKGDTLAAASNGSTVRILRLFVTPESTRAEVEKVAFEKHSDAITDVEYSRGGDYVVSSSADRTVRVFEPRMGMAQRYFSSPPLPGIVTSATFHPKGNLVVSGCDDGGVRLHTVTPPGIQLLGKFDAPARRPEFSADGKFVLAASGDKTARVWPIVAPREIVRITHEAPVTRATFRPVVDGDRYDFATTATNGEVRCIRLIEPASAAKPTETVLEPRHPGAAVSAAWSQDGNWLATVGGGEVILWKWINDSPVARLRMVDLNPATSRAEFSPDARLLVTYGGDQIAHVWDLSKLPSATR